MTYKKHLFLFVGRDAFLRRTTTSKTLVAPTFSLLSYHFGGVDVNEKRSVIKSFVENQ